MKDLNPFDFMNAASFSKEDLIRNSDIPEHTEKMYTPYVVNRGFTNFEDTILHANEMNMHHHLDHRVQFDFLINIIRTKKRWTKWIKASEIDHIEIIKEHYGYSDEKAKSALSLLSHEQIEILKQRIYKGGKTKYNNKR